MRHSVCSHIQKVGWGREGGDTKPPVSEQEQCAKQIKSGDRGLDPGFRPWTDWCSKPFAPVSTFLQVFVAFGGSFPF